MLVGCFGFGISVNASLIGDTVDCATTGVGISCSPLSTIVGSELEFTLDDSNFGPRIGVDIGASSIQLSESNSFINVTFGNITFTLSILDFTNSFILTLFYRALPTL